MKITVTGRQMTVRESLKEAIDKKLRKFDKFFGEQAEAFVTCKVRKSAKIIEISIPYLGTLFRSEEESSAFVTALDRATESLEQQIRKNKTRLAKRMKKGAFSAPGEEFSDTEEEGEFQIRIKTYEPKPMSPEEAILQMNLSDHAFFVFVDETNGATCVVYKKKDGNYGMIVPSHL